MTDKTQTLADKLRVIADAIDANDGLIIVDGQDRATVDWAIQNVSFSNIKFSRAPAQIKVGERLINAPLRVMPNDGDSYLWVDGRGGIVEYKWSDEAYDIALFNNANCWATEADAKAYVEASLAVRKGAV